MQDNYKIKLSEIEFNEQTIKGAFLSLQEYAILRDVPYQTIVEEVNEANNRKPYRKTIYYPDIKSIFVYGEKPLYTYLDAKIYRNELINKNPQKSYEIITHPENIQGYWISLKEYANFINYEQKQITNLISKNKIEFGQIYEKNGKEYRFFIPTQPEPYTHLELQMLLTQLELKKQKAQISDIKIEDLKTQATELGRFLKDNPNIAEILEELSCLSAEDFISLKEILIHLKPEDIKKIKIVADGYTKIFK